MGEAESARIGSPLGNCCAVGESATGDAPAGKELVDRFLLGISMGPAMRALRARWNQLLSGASERARDSLACPCTRLIG